MGTKWDKGREGVVAASDWGFCSWCARGGYYVGLLGLTGQLRRKLKPASSGSYGIGRSVNSTAEK